MPYILVVGLQLLCLLCCLHSELQLSQALQRFGAPEPALDPAAGAATNNGCWGASGDGCACCGEALAATGGLGQLVQALLSRNIWLAKLLRLLCC